MKKYFADLKGGYINSQGKYVVRIELDDSDKYLFSQIATKKFGTMEFMVFDSDTLTNRQRKLLYALFKEFADYAGEEEEFIKQRFKELFCASREYDAEYFSLSNIPKNLASDFIEFVLEEFYMHGIPISKKLYYSELGQIEKKNYLDVLYKKCACCGSAENIELHHVDQIGIGHDRDTVEHIGRRVLALCSKHHKTAHSMGTVTFIEKFGLKPPILTKELLQRCKSLGHYKHINLRGVK